jgi:cell division protein FtsQ
LLCFGGKKLLEVAYKSDKMLIKNIEVFGAKNVTKSEIKELLPFNIGDNLLKINLSEAEEEIKKLKPELKNIVINRRWQKVRVMIYERIPEAFVVNDDSIVGIDFDDKSFPLRGFMSAMKVPKIICKSASERKQLLKFIKRFKSVCGEFLDNISEIKFSNTGDIVFIMNSNTVVFWGEEIQEHLAHKFKKLQKIYVDAMARYKQIEYIDMTPYCFERAIVKPIVN